MAVPLIGNAQVQAYMRNLAIPWSDLQANYQNNLYNYYRLSEFLIT